MNLRLKQSRSVRPRFPSRVMALMVLACAAAIGCTSPPSSNTAVPGGESRDEQASAGGGESQRTQDTSASTTAGGGGTNDVPQLLTAEELSDGWIALFDGESLYGWKAGSDADWRVESRAIVVSSGTPGLLCTTTAFADYVLKVDFRSAAGTNSGIFLRTPLVPKDPAADCYELNIADRDNPFPTGSFVKRKKVEGNYDSSDWQSYEVTVDGDRVSVKLDGRPILDYTDPRPLRRGFIGLQLNQGKVEFRNIKLKPLGLVPIFNGQDLAGWKTYPEMASVFSVTPEGYLNVKNIRDGRGQLESEKLYGDLILQLECITHARELNSGIFFRCIPGEEMNGYESQIHNGFLDGDRHKPKDYGTGAIFRRQAARLVVPNDLEWFHKTIIADGPHMAVWVNGYQVSDWIDDRPPHANPRNGKRLEPGSIMIQGHDATTNLSFRKLRAAELPGGQL